MGVWGGGLFFTGSNRGVLVVLVLGRLSREVGMPASLALPLGGGLFWSAWHTYRTQRRQILSLGDTKMENRPTASQVNKIWKVITAINH